MIDEKEISRMWAMTDYELISSAVALSPDDEPDIGDRLAADMYRGLFGSDFGQEKRRMLLNKINAGIRGVLDNKEAKQILINRICGDLRYCQRVRHHEDVHAVAAVVEILSHALFHFHFPGIAFLCVWLIKRGFLDELCGCD